MSFLWGSSHKAHAVQTEKDAFWFLNLTPEQEQAHHSFQAHLAQSGSLLAGHDDKWTLLRFLKARQWDVEKAALMYNNMRKWRAEHKTDHVFQTFEFHEIDKVLPVYPHFYHKTDRFGRPVYIELLGRTDPHKLLEATQLDRLLDYHITEWEHLKKHILPACSEQLGKPIITKDVIIDLKGLSMKNFSSSAQKILHTIAHIDQDYYPEHLGQMFIINTPTIFRAIWAVVNPMLEERTRRKIVILGSDYMSTVVQLIPEENLPTILGGKSPLELADIKNEVGPWVGWSHKEKAPLAKFSSEPVADMVAAAAAEAANANGLVANGNGGGNPPITHCFTDPKHG